MASAVSRVALRVEIGREVEQARDLGDARVDLGLRHAAILQRERQVLADRHGVVDHRKLEHLRDVALLGRQRRDVGAVEQDFAARRRDDAGDQVEQRGLAAAGRPEQRIGAALPPGHGHRLERKRFRAAHPCRRRNARDRRGQCGPCCISLTLAPGEATRRPAASKTKTLSGSSTASSTWPGAIFVHALQHRDPVRGVAIEMHETFRAGDLGHRHGGRKRVAAGDAVGDLELMGAEADPIGAVGKTGIESARRRRDAAGILHRAVLLFDSDDVERRIGKHLRNAQGIGMAIDLRRSRRPAAPRPPTCRWCGRRAAAPRKARWSHRRRSRPEASKMRGNSARSSSRSL